MYEHFRGRVIDKNPAYVVVECGGVGYLLNISLNTYSQLPEDEGIFLFAHQVVREDAHVLYGFIDKAEREIFLKLISVSGVGASTARVMLSSLSPSEIQVAIQSENVGALKAIKGIGAKTAERIIVDLKDKIGADSPELEKIQFAGNSVLEEALSALVALGFEKGKARKVLQKMLDSDGEIPVENLVKQALKHL